MCILYHVIVFLQGGLIAAHVAIQKQELFQGLVLSSTPTSQMYNRGIKKLAVSTYWYNA